MPVFVDTLADHETTRRFGERYGSYPVIRIQDHDGQELSPRLDGNPVRGRIPVTDLLAQMHAGLAEYRKRRQAK